MGQAKFFRQKVISHRDRWERDLGKRVANLSGAGAAGGLGAGPPLAVAAVAAQFGIPVVVLAGAVGAGTQALLQIVAFAEVGGLAVGRGRRAGPPMGAVLHPADPSRKAVPPQALREHGLVVGAPIPSAAV